MYIVYEYHQGTDVAFGILFTWRHQMETFSALLTICAGNSPVPGEFPAQRPVTRSFDVFFDLRLNKRLSKQWWGWWFEMPSSPLWRHCNESLRNCPLTKLMRYSSEKYEPNWWYNLYQKYKKIETPHTWSLVQSNRLVNTDIPMWTYSDTFRFALQWQS